MYFTAVEVLAAHSVSITKSDRQILPPTRSGSVSGLKNGLRPTGSSLVHSDCIRVREPFSLWGCAR